MRKLYQFFFISSGPLSPERDDLLPVGDEHDERLGQLVRVGRSEIKSISDSNRGPL